MTQPNKPEVEVVNKSDVNSKLICITKVIAESVIMADDVVVFNKTDLPLIAYPSFEDIRRRGKLCDVTLKVIVDENYYYYEAGRSRRQLVLLSSTVTMLSVVDLYINRLTKS